MNSLYKEDFYKERHRKTVHAAETISALVREHVPDIRSAVDFGCGVGTWLSVFQRHGATEVLGLDGDWVERNMLEIDAACFRPVHMEDVTPLDRRFDLAISLEVAEHLPETRADAFVNVLTQASDIVLFSAAIPDQGGVGHVNEQWPDYWAAKFAARGFSPLDFIRMHIWDDESIPYWYRQNIVLFVREEKLSELRLPEGMSPVQGVPALVHPALYAHKIERMSGLKNSFKLFRRALNKKLMG